MECAVYSKAGIRTGQPFRSGIRQAPAGPRCPFYFGECGLGDFIPKNPRSSLLHFIDEENEAPRESG